jgi:hypothetical protein
MDSGNRPVIRHGAGIHTPPAPGFSILNINTKVPSELKYLINYYKTVRKLPSFSLAVRELLESHPALAQIAGELYTRARSQDGPTGP